MFAIRRPNIPIALLSLFLSIGLWTHVQLQTASPGQRGTISVRLNGENLPEGLYASIPTVVNVEVEGTQEQISAVENSNQVIAKVDLSKAIPGRHIFDVTLERGEFIRIPMELSRERITIDIEKEVRKQFPVSVDTLRQLPESLGMEYTDALVLPATVELSGPESKIAAVAQVRALLDLSKVEPQKDFVISVEALDKRGVPLGESVRAEPPQVTIRPALMPKPQAKAVIINPNFQGHPAIGFRVTGYEMDPNQIFVSGSSLDVARITTLETRPINIEGLKETTTLNVQLALPEGIELAKPRAVTVRVVIEPAPTVPDSNPGPVTSTGTTGGQ